MEKKFYHCYKSSWAVMLCLFCSTIALAQNKPFPQNITYPYGFKTATITAGNITADYANWKSKYLIDCGSGNYRVQFDASKNNTVSEGMGYGMVISAYMGDRDTFDKLWNFVQKNFNADQLEGWKTTCNGFYNEYNSDGSVSNSGSVPATDGDEDIIFGLLLADVQWGGYKTPATDYIGRVKTKLYRQKNGHWLQLPGFEWNYENTSYLIPSYYRLFKEVTGDPFWDEVLADTYYQLNANRNATTGLISNECDENGTANPNYNVVDYNGARIPWRVVSDYLWSGSTYAQNICLSLTDWADNKGLSNVYDGYKTDGTPTSGWNQSPAWTGAWACGAMVKSQAVVDNFAAYFKACTYDEYFASSLRLLYSLTLTGNAWKPVFAANSSRTTYGNNGNPWSISASAATRIEAENFDTGGQGIAYNDTDVKNHGGQYRKKEGVDIRVCSEGGYKIGRIQAGEWLEYTIYVSASASYDFTLRTARKPKGNSAVKLLVDGVAKTADLAVPSTLSKQIWTNVTAKNIPLTAGLHTLRILMTQSKFNLNWIELAPSPVTTTRYEAENATLVGTSVNNYYTAFSGTGYVDGLDNMGDKMDFAVTAAAAGTYALKIRYATCNDQLNFVKVNGALVGGISTTFTGNVCGLWIDKILTVSLNAGSDVISIEKDWGYMPVDYIELTAPASARKAAVEAEVSATEAEQPVGFEIFPNPTTQNTFTIRLSQEQSGQFYVTNLQGTAVFQGVIDAQEMVVYLPKSLNKGLYLVTVISGKKMETKKLLVD